MLSSIPLWKWKVNLNSPRKWTKVGPEKGQIFKRTCHFPTIMNFLDLFSWCWWYFLRFPGWESSPWKNTSWENMFGTLSKRLVQIQDFKSTHLGDTPIFHWTMILGRNYGCFQNSGTPKSSILIGFSIINHPFGDTPIFGNTMKYPYITSFHVCSRLDTDGFPRKDQSTHYRRYATAVSLCGYHAALPRRCWTCFRMVSWGRWELHIYQIPGYNKKCLVKNVVTCNLPMFFLGFLKFSVSQLNFNVIWMKSRQNFIFSGYAGGSSVRTVKPGVVVEKYQLDREDGSYMWKR